MNKSQIEYISTTALIPYARNSRTHSDEQVAQVAASIKEFGFTNPVLIDQDNGIIAGHGRVMAAMRLKLDEVPCIRLSHLSETQKRAYIIADNKLALNSGWDDELLALEIKDLQGMDFEIDILGFDDSEIDDILGLAEDEDFEPELNSDDREPIRNMTFTVSDEQHAIIEEVLKLAKDFDPEDPMGINENTNGNALWYVCEVFKTAMVKE
jgi:ParB-like chromosome segregation protein Spo0J